MSQDVEQSEMLVKLAEEIVKLTRMISDQAEVIKGLMFIIDAAMSMSRMHHERLTALEQRAMGLSFEDLVDGKELKPLGPTQSHYEMLTKINQGLINLTDSLNRD